MSKLTQDQIEAERVKFEKYFSGKALYELCLGWDEFYLFENEYAQYSINKEWKVWLACRESIEIQFPSYREYEDWSSYTEGFNDALDRAECLIESQGFKVVTK